MKARNKKTVAMVATAATMVREAPTTTRSYGNSFTATLVSGLSGKSCRLHQWCNQLSPEVEQRAFTPEEVEIIDEARQVRK
ncbi:transcription factor MYB44-like [Pyrus ussuriensis x Pyrus communis]|uniref:Transcription factor MYB44-like n=1 Tax=Pyrus ussuriensis x Pyrus communis TaxID=2448454 RepID=A0A5N5GF37_9ROSA|nr:transcription factor MYB44-like [Pyrus ussuriensis x Pyrus communis]